MYGSHSICRYIVQILLLARRRDGACAISTALNNDLHDRDGHVHLLSSIRPEYTANKIKNPLKIKIKMGD